MVERWGLPALYGSSAPPYNDLMRMQAVLNVYNAVDRFFGLRGEDIHTLTDNEREIIALARDEGWL